MYVSKVQIENWKNFRALQVDLGYRTFLVGPNASGKSNFLDIFRFLRDISVTGGGLQKAIDSQRGGISAIRCLSARQHSNIVIELHISEDNGDDIWQYRLSINQDNNRKPRIREERVRRNGVSIINRPDAADITDSVRLTETALEQTSANKDFRQIVQFFQSVSYQHLLPQVVRDPSGFSPGKIDNDPFGRDFLQRVEATSAKFRDSRLKKILAALQVAVPQLGELKAERDSFGVPHLVGLYQHWRPKAGLQNESQFSDGTLRLFGLLWTLFEGNGPLLMEEPELSLHPEIVRHLPQMIERISKDRKVKRQIIVSTHSEEILSDPGIGANEVLRLEPSADGTKIKLPDEEERELLRNGLTIAEVILPNSGPKNSSQLGLVFDK